jgi:hypothetical protein
MSRQSRLSASIAMLAALTHIPTPRTSEVQLKPTVL